MTKNKLKLLEISDPAKRHEYIKKLISPETNPRQKILKMTRDYYDGIHWEVRDNGSVNTTRSGKLIWGKGNTNSRNGSDVYGRDSKSNFDVGFRYGQIQKKNLIKKFIQTYQDYVLGSEVDEFDIEVRKKDYEEGVSEENEVYSEDEISKYITELWDVQKESFVREQLAKGIINTVMVSKIEYNSSDNSYTFRPVDAIDIFPIKEGDSTIGYMNAYEMDSEDSRIFGVDSKEKLVTTFADIYWQEDNQVYMIRLVEGYPVILTDSGYQIVSWDVAVQALAEELNFLPYSIETNIDHAFRDFDDMSLEDSEIFEWIDQNDSLNANETLAFLGNLYYALPKPKLDFDAIGKSEVDINSPEFKQALVGWSYQSFALDTMPINVETGNEIGQSFYNNLDRIENGAYESASIPKFIVSGAGISAVSERTVQLSLAAFIKKITNKREKIEHLIEYLSESLIQLMGGDPEQYEVYVNYPSILEPTVEQLADIFIKASERNVLPNSYVQRKILEITGNEEDISEVKIATDQEVMKIVNEVKKEESVQKQQLAQQKNKEQMSQLDAILNVTKDI